MTWKINVKSGLDIIIILGVTCTLVFPAMILAEAGSTSIGQEVQKDEEQKILAPILPFEAYGRIYIDNVLLSTTDYTLMTLVNDTVFGQATPVTGGLFSIDTYGDHTDTPEVREGGWNGDLVYYLLKKNDGVPGRRWMCAEETFTFVSGGWINVNMHFSTTGSPWPLKISSLTPNPVAGNDFVSIYNPSNESVDLTNWLLRDRDGMNMPLTGKSIPPNSEIAVNLGTDVLSGLTDGGPMSGDEIALCWRDPIGVMGDGEWIAMDLVEYGNQNNFYDNTTLWDYSTTPGTGYKLARSPEPFTDTENCSIDFLIKEVPLAIDIPLGTGWNLVSFPQIPSNMSVENVLAPILSNCVVVKTYDSYDVADPWESYSPTRPESICDLRTLDNSMAFWVNTNGPCTLHIEGAEPINSNIPLKAGWNLVGYPTLINMTVSAALAGTGYDRPVECYDGISPYYLRQMGNAEFMTPGKGYWVHVPANTVWNVNVNPGIANPYPVYGFVYLYDGTSTGGYNPKHSSGGANVEIKWWNPVIGWDTVVTGTSPTGQYYSDIANYVEGGVIFINATFDAPYGNKGYNYTYIDSMMGSSYQNVLCGIPYEIVMYTYWIPEEQPQAGVPFLQTYVILDRNHNLAKGYYTFSDGPIVMYSDNFLAILPPPSIFQGTSDASPASRSEWVTINTMGFPMPTTLGVRESIQNNYLTPWGQFYIDPGHTRQGWLNDFDEVTYFIF